MRQAITTKYLPATNVKGSRIKASCQRSSVTLSWDDSLNIDGNHAAAAQALADKLNWGGEWLGGFDKDNRGVFVMLCEDSKVLLAR